MTTVNPIPEEDMASKTTNEPQATDTPQMEEEEKSETIDLRNYASMLKRYWWVMLACIVVGVGLAALYLKIKSPTYLMKAMVMVNQNDDDEGGGIGGGALGVLMSSFSLGGGSVNIDDEVLRLNSYSEFKQLVKDLDLNTLYWSRDSYFVPKKSYFRKSPINIHVPENILDTLSAQTLFAMSIPTAGTPIHISVQQEGADPIEKDVSKFPCDIKTPYGTFTLTLTQHFKPGTALNLKASVVGYNDAIQNIREAISISKTDRKANAISLDIEDMDKERGMATLNRLIENYNQRGLDDKNRQAIATAKFLEDRLLKIYGELTSSENDIEAYKKKNNITDPTVDAQFTFEKRGMIEEKALEMATQGGILKLLREYLVAPANRYALAPFATDLPELPIETYNTLVLERMRLESNVKNNDNTALRTISAQVDAMRQNILTSIDKKIQSTNIAISGIDGQLSKSDSRINSAPTFEKELRALYRDQTIKNQIYGFLLQKREENEMKIAKNTPKAVIIDEAYYETEPVKPRKIIIWGGGLIGGFIMGACAIMLLDSLKRRKKSTAKD